MDVIQVPTRESNWVKELDMMASSALLRPDFKTRTAIRPKEVTRAVYPGRATRGKGDDGLNARPGFARCRRQPQTAGPCC